MNHLLLSNIAASIVKGQHEKGAAVSESLFQKAEQYSQKCKKRLSKIAEHL